jgi:hypothetical protein
VWLNDPEVRAAIHAVPPSRHPWMLCTDLLSYTHDMGSMIAIHRRMTQEKGVRAWGACGRAPERVHVGVPQRGCMWARPREGACGRAPERVHVGVWGGRS